MTTAWVVYVLAVGMLLAIGAVLLVSALRLVGHPTRFVHASALATILVLALIAPRRDVVVPTALPTGVVVAAPVSSALRSPTWLDRARGIGAVIERATTTLSETMRRRVSPAAARIALVVWASVSLVLLALFVAVSRRLWSARRSWEKRSVHGTPVRVSSDVGPAVIGFLHPEIVVPHWLLECPPDEQRLILAHEREHLRAHDHLLLGGAWLAAIVVPWHPAVWFLVSRIRLAIELDCDARVLRAGASPRLYGALLIDVAARRGAGRIGALALTDGPTHLERRIQAMQWRRGRHAVTGGLALAAAGALLVLAACEAKVPTAAEVAQMDVNALEKKAAELDLVESKIGQAAYVVNGDPVSADSARAIAATKIGSVEVVKGTAAGGRDTIFVTTSDRMARVRSRSGEETLVPFPEMGHRLGRNAVLMIDNVVQPQGVKVRLDPKEVASISVLKPGKDASYPDGLIAIETKRRDGRISRALETAPRVIRTDSVVVSSAAGLSSATRSIASSGAGRVVVMPRSDSAGSFHFSVADMERARLSSGADTSSSARRRAAGVTTDYSKPVAIEIDGRRATKAELDALRASGAMLSYTMYPHDMRARSSDPAAANGLLLVKTEQPTKP